MKIVALPLNMKTADIEYDRTNGIIPRFAELYGFRISQGRKLRCWPQNQSPRGIKRNFSIAIFALHRSRGNRISKRIIASSNL
jgi:hypothetical protein